ncbi:MAG TPA: GGDEF domain-containing phosphodiesterase [Baekduia sp.]|uniref:putative bifunctional diguanylate cyclase/phosphodiesterase n=1 Tax=Baekduia sp. TaxID=2600305 RepID=UPI002D7886E1|nr:GGDEF domain-containing phosphodiesterase [Baekduia sp.]HET6510367.1 GGDEF domain-containing phosphodiesterase [Baekduia sp.]
MGKQAGRSTRRTGAATVARALGAAGAALVALGLLTALAQAHGRVDDVRHVAVFAIAAATVAARAVDRPSGRAIWAFFALGCAVNTVAEAVSVSAAGSGTEGAAGALYALAYLATCVALFLFLRRRVGDTLLTFSFDALGIAVYLSVSAIGSAVLVRPMTEHAGLTELDAATTLVFTAADVAIASIIWAVASFTGRARGRQDRLLAAALLVMFCGDFADVLGRAGWLTGTEPWSRLGWECSMLLVAAAAWARPATAGSLRVGGWWETVPTLSWIVSGTGVLVAATIVDLPTASVVLAVAALALGALRSARIAREVRRLVIVRAESLVDEATGAANQRALFGELTLLTREGGSDGRHAALLIGHLEGFDELTDTLGHEVAGDVLRRVTARLIDAAPGTLARMDNGEFATIAEDMGPEALAALLSAALAAPVESDGLAVSVRPVFGYARFPEDARSPTGLARRADMARRDARDRGLGVAAYDPARDTHSRDRLTLAADLRRALRSPTAPDGSGLWLALQPQVDPRTDALRGVEALIRWRHPTRATVSPAELLPVAERDGLMSELTDWVLDHALAAVAALRAEVDDLHVAVNVSAVTLVDAGLPERIEAALVRHRIPPEALVIEVTEDAVMRDHRHCRDVLGRIAALGVEIAIDDFGTGHSSMAQLRHMPADELKIDQRFVRGMTADPVDEEMVRMMIALGRKMGLRVVAEGAETPLERELLAAMGCDLVQGYVVGRPMSADQLGGWLDARRPMRREAA